MRLRTSRAVLTTAAVGAAALTIGLTSTGARADTAPRPGSDVVGVGSDTVQNLADFVFDAPGPGATATDSGTNGYNAGTNTNRVFNIYATGDANGRALYTAAGAPLATTVILQAGTKPVARPNGSGAGIAALEADAAGGTGYSGLPLGSIQFARMSRLPNSGEISACAVGSTCGGIHLYQVATDQLQIAHLTSGYHGPAAGLSAQQLVHIYQCDAGYTSWSSIPGSQGTGTIHPLIPQTGSGTRNFFLADLQAANGGNAITLGPCVGTVQEHDPSGIVNDTTPADAIEPFSVGKLKLINSGYFSNGGAAFNANTLTSDSAATSSDGANAAYNSARGLFFAIRQKDLTGSSAAGPFQPGGTQNFGKVLFDGGTSYIARAAVAGNIEAAGFTPQYINCGTLPSTVPGCS